MEPFKNKISAELVGLIAAHLPDPAAFEAAVVPKLDALELKERVRLVADTLLTVLPEDPLARHAALRAMLHSETHEGFDRVSDERGIAGWGIWPLSLVVGEHGAGAFDDAMETLREMTKRATAEFAIRPLIVADAGRAFAILADWVTDPDHHVRRLVSEGTRPRLPWGLRLTDLVADPSPCLPLLEALRDDPSEYVRRSVANHLNDIAKDHPALVVEVCGCWLEGASKERAALVRHACRTLIKAGDPDALSLFGLGPAQIDVSDVRLSSGTVGMGETLTFEVDITSRGDAEQDLIIDYVMHLRKANGATAPKVFKGGKIRLAPGEVRSFRKAHVFKHVTTRRAYGGDHAVGLRINGADFAAAPFVLTV